MIKPGAFVTSSTSVTRRRSRDMPQYHVPTMLATKPVPTAILTLLDVVCHASLNMALGKKDGIFFSCLFFEMWSFFSGKKNYTE
jgi:hypothetical protein